MYLITFFALSVQLLVMGRRLDFSDLPIRHRGQLIITRKEKKTRLKIFQMFTNLISTNALDAYKIYNTLDI